MFRSAFGETLLGQKTINSLVLSPECLLKAIVATEIVMCSEQKKSKNWFKQNAESPLTLFGEN